MEKQPVHSIRKLCKPGSNPQNQAKGSFGEENITVMLEDRNKQPLISHSKTWRQKENRSVLRSCPWASCLFQVILKVSARQQQQNWETGITLINSEGAAHGMRQTPEILVLLKDRIQTIITSLHNLTEWTLSWLEGRGPKTRNSKWVQDECAAAPAAATCEQKPSLLTNKPYQNLRGEWEKEPYILLIWIYGDFFKKNKSKGQRWLSS